MPPWRKGHGYRARESGRSAATRRHSRASPSPWATGSTRWRTGSCATSTSPRTRRSRRCSTIWRDLPQLRDPARFEAWSYRLLVRACYAEGRRTRRWAPNIAPAGRRAGGGGRPRLGRRSRPARARLPAALHRPSRGGRAAPLPRPAPRRGRRERSASPSGRSAPDSITRCAGCARRSMPTRGRRHRRLPDEHRPRRHPHRPVVAGGRRHDAPGPRPRRVLAQLPTTPQRRPGGRRGGLLDEQRLPYPCSHRRHGGVALVGIRFAIHPGTSGGRGRHTDPRRAPRSPPTASAESDTPVPCTSTPGGARRGGRYPIKVPCAPPSRLS